MKRLPENSHLLSFQVIGNEWFNLLSVIQYAIKRVSYFDLLLTLTPGSSFGVPVNSIPASLNAFKISKRVRGLQFTIPICVSSRFIVGKLTLEAPARSLAVQPNNARAALI